MAQPLCLVEGKYNFSASEPATPCLGGYMKNTEYFCNSSRLGKSRAKKSHDIGRGFFQHPVGTNSNELVTAAGNAFNHFFQDFFGIAKYHHGFV